MLISSSKLSATSVTKSLNKQAGKQTRIFNFHLLIPFFTRARFIHMTKFQYTFTSKPLHFHILISLEHVINFFRARFIHTTKFEYTFTSQPLHFSLSLVIFNLRRFVRYKYMPNGGNYFSYHVPSNCSCGNIHHYRYWFCNRNQTLHDLFVYYLHCQIHHMDVSL